MRVREGHSGAGRVPQQQLILIPEASEVGPLQKCDTFDGVSTSPSESDRHRHTALPLYCPPAATYCSPLYGRKWRRVGRFVSRRYDWCATVHSAGRHLLCGVMEDDDGQLHADEHQSAALLDAHTGADDADMQAAAVDDDSDNDGAAVAEDASNESSHAHSHSQSSRWRRAGPPVALPPLASYSHLTACSHFPQLLSFLRTFRVSLGLTAFSTLDLLTALTVPSSSPFHVDVVWGLLWSAGSCSFSLRKHKEMEDARMGGAKVDPVRYPSWWQLFLRWWSDEWQHLYDRNPFEQTDRRRQGRDTAHEADGDTETVSEVVNGSDQSEKAVSRGWDDLDGVERCVILEWLCEWKLGQEGEGGLRSEDGQRAAVDELEVDSLRVGPLGFNEQGDAYYYFGHDAFVFVEHRSETSTQTEATVTSQRPGKSRARGAAKQSSSASKPANSHSNPSLLPQHATLHRWSVLCSTLSEMQQVLPTLQHSAPDVADWLQENVAEKMASTLERRRGAEERRARMALVPRKRSSRIQMGELRREEEERREEERRKTQEEERQRKEEAMKERQRERNRRRREAEAERMKEIETELMKEKLDTLASEREARQRERERLQLELRMRRAAQERREARRMAANEAGDGEQDDQQDEDDEEEYAESEEDSEYGNVVKLVSAARLAPDETLQLFSSDNVSAHLTGRHLRVAVKRKGILWPPPREEQKPQAQQQQRAMEEQMVDDGALDGQQISKGDSAEQTSRRKKKRKERRKKKERQKRNGDRSESDSDDSSDDSSSNSSSDSDSPSQPSSDEERKRRKRRKKKRRGAEEAADAAKDSRRKKKARRMRAEAEDGKSSKEKVRKKLTRKRRKAAAGDGTALSTSSSSTSSPAAHISVQSAVKVSMSPLQQQQQQQWLLQLAHNAAVQRFQQQAAASSMSPEMQVAAARQYAAFLYMKQVEEQSKSQQASAQQQQQQVESGSGEQHSPLLPQAGEQPAVGPAASSAMQEPPRSGQHDGSLRTEQQHNVGVESSPIAQSPHLALSAADIMAATQQPDSPVQMDGGSAREVVTPALSDPVLNVMTHTAPQHAQPEQSGGGQAEAEAMHVAGALQA